MELKLAPIPAKEYAEYRYEVIFEAYKWDPQVGDGNTVSPYAVVLDRNTAAQLEEWAERLAEETVLMENALLKNPALAKELTLPKKILRLLKKTKRYDPQKNVRLMRFDFHPTDKGWAVSEVNSDVPGGFAEASVLPQIAQKYFTGCAPAKNAADCLLQAFKTKFEPQRVAFVHATSYSDDRQVMECLADCFGAQGIEPVFAAPDHLRWKDKKAVSVVAGAEGEIDGIIRFFPLEWLLNLPKKTGYKGYFDCLTPACNHPAALLTQSKRLPLVWDRLGIDIPAWKSLLPETKSPQAIKKTNKPHKKTDEKMSGKADTQPDGWIYKPAFGRVGEGISIKSAVSKRELAQIEKAARKYPKYWVAQRMFNSRPIAGENGDEFHLCIGVFVINGKSAGFYGRINEYARIDGNAKDIAVLIGDN